MNPRIDAPSIIVRLIDAVLSIVLFMLGLRFILKLFAANPETSFVSWVYAVTVSLLSPFSGIFPSPTLENGIIVEFTTVFAILIYIMLAYLLVELIKYISYGATQRYTVTTKTVSE